MSLSSSIVCVSGCRWPSRGRAAGQRGIERRGRRACGGAARPVALAAAAKAASIARLHFVEPLAGGRLVGRGDRAELFCSGFEPAALGAEELDAGRFERGGIAGGVEGRLGGSFATRRVRRGSRRVPCVGALQSSARRKRMPISKQAKRTSRMSAHLAVSVSALTNGERHSRPPALLSPGRRRRRSRPDRGSPSRRASCGRGRCSAFSRPWMNSL